MNIGAWQTDGKNIGAWQGEVSASSKSSSSSSASSISSSSSSSVYGGIFEYVDQEQTLHNINTTFGNQGGNQYLLICQSFKVSETLRISAIELYFNTRQGSPSTQVTMRVETDSDYIHSGVLVDPYASIDFDVTDNIPLKETFSRSFLLLGGVTYWIVLSLSSQSYDFYYRLGGSNVNPYPHGGQSSGGVASEISDIYFKVYAFEGGSSSSSRSSSSSSSSSCRSSSSSCRSSSSSSSSSSSRSFSSSSSSSSSKSSSSSSSCRSSSSSSSSCRSSSSSCRSSSSSSSSSKSSSSSSSSSSSLSSSSSSSQSYSSSSSSSSRSSTSSSSSSYALLYPVVDQQQTTQDVGAAVGEVSGGQHRLAQGFKLSGNLTLMGVEVYAGSKISSPTGNWTFRIETDNGSNNPSGTLAHANASIIVTPVTSQIVYASFANPFPLSGSTTYWLVIQCDNQPNDYYWTFRCNQSGGYADGGLRDTIDGGSTWVSYEPWDMYFKIYVATDSSSSSSRSSSSSSRSSSSSCRSSSSSSSSSSCRSSSSSSSSSSCRSSSSSSSSSSCRSSSSSCRSSSSSSSSSKSSSSSSSQSYSSSSSSRSSSSSSRSSSSSCRSSSSSSSSSSSLSLSSSSRSSSSSSRSSSSSSISSSSTSNSSSSSSSQASRLYSRGEYASLPVNSADLTSLFTSDEYIEVKTEGDDEDTVKQISSGTDNAIFEFKNLRAGTQIQVTWKGKTNLSPSCSSVQLQIWNKTSSEWEVIDTDNTSEVDTIFTLTAVISPLTDYQDTNGFISCRVWQNATSSSSSSSLSSSSSSSENPCWVAAEIYGEDYSKPKTWKDIRTLNARNYIKNIAPNWLRNGYIKYGERIAYWLHNNQWAKIFVRPIIEYFSFKGR